MANLIPELFRRKKTGAGEREAPKPTDDESRFAQRRFRDDSDVVFIAKDRMSATAALRFHLMVEDQHRTITLNIPVQRDFAFAEADFEALLGALCDMQKYLDVVGRVEN